MNFLELTNMSLDLLGEKSISSFTGNKGQLYERWAKHIWRELARKYRWNFLRTSRTVSRNPLKMHSSYCYNLPADYAQLYDKLSGEYHLEGMFLLVEGNAPEVISLDYISNDIQLLGFAPETFVTLFVYELAAALAYQLTGDAKLMQTLQQKAILTSHSAMFCDDIEKSPGRSRKILKSNWLRR